MKRIWILVVLLMIFLTACSQGEDTLTADIDLTTLEPAIDVKTVDALRDHPGVVILDVREQWEYDEGHIPGVTLIPMGEVPSRLDEIPTDKEIIVTCRTGNRSGQVADYLRQQGYDNVHNMLGGIVAWEEAGLSVER